MTLDLLDHVWKQRDAKESIRSNTDQSVFEARMGTNALYTYSSLGTISFHKIELKASDP